MSKSNRDAGLETLFTLYKGTGWEFPEVPEEKMIEAKKRGYLFDYPKYETHEETLARMRQVVAQIDPKDVANAFLFSLSTRKLEYRSALGSYYYAKAVPEHEFMYSHNEILVALACECYFCHWQAWRKEPDEFELRFGYNFFNYERYKYGGSIIGKNTVNYALFDLEQFIKLPKVAPTEEDKRIFAEILSCVGRLISTDKVGKLRDTISKAKIFKCNKDEISVLLNELGICGVLASKEFPSYDVRFANVYERDSVEYRNDFAYPVNRWYARDGINKEKLAEVFGEDVI